MEVLDLEKINSFFNVISHQSDIDKIYLYGKGPFETKYMFVINKQESTGLKHLNDSKTFTEYSNDIDSFYEKIEECNPNEKSKILITFDDIIADMLSNRKIIQ